MTTRFEPLAFIFTSCDLPEHRLTKTSWARSGDHEGASSSHALFETFVCELPSIPIVEICRLPSSRSEANATLVESVLMAGERFWLESAVNRDSR